MVVIRTYLRSRDGGFTDPAAVRTPPPDPRVVEGAIELIVDGVEIIGRPEWDDVDELWVYLARMVRTLETETSAGTLFPDQPIELTFERAGRTIKIKSTAGPSVREARADAAELVASVRAAGAEFFHRMIELIPENAAGYRAALAELG